MKIGQGSGSTPWNANVQDRVETLRKPGNGQESAANVTLSALSGQLHDIEEQLNTGSGFDASRVESIKAAIRAGEFKVNPSKVADKLLATVRELVGK